MKVSIATIQDLAHLLLELLDLLLDPRIGCLELLVGFLLGGLRSRALCLKLWRVQSAQNY